MWSPQVWSSNLQLDIDLFLGESTYLKHDHQILKVKFMSPTNHIFKLNKIVALDARDIISTVLRFPVDIQYK